MRNAETQGKAHQVAPTQIILKQVADVCDRYGIDFTPNKLHYEKYWETASGRWTFNLTERDMYNFDGTRVVGTCLVGMERYDSFDFGAWKPYGALMEEFEPHEIAAFNEIAALMSVATGQE